MALRPGRQRSRAVPIIAKGEPYAQSNKSGSVLKKCRLRFDFVAVSQDAQSESARLGKQEKSGDFKSFLRFFCS